jgi:hypothetical protein
MQPGKVFVVVPLKLGDSHIVTLLALPQTTLGSNQPVICNHVKGLHWRSFAYLWRGVGLACQELVLT